MSNLPKREILTRSKIMKELEKCRHCLEDLASML